MSVPLYQFCPETVRYWYSQDEPRLLGINGNKKAIGMVDMDRHNATSMDQYGWYRRFKKELVSHLRTGTIFLLQCYATGDAIPNQ